MRIEDWWGLTVWHEGSEAKVQSELLLAAEFQLRSRSLLLLSHVFLGTQITTHQSLPVSALSPSPVAISTLWQDLLIGDTVFNPCNLNLQSLAARSGHLGNRICTLISTFIC